MSSIVNNLVQDSVAGYLSTMGGVIMYIIKFEYHIQGILWIHVVVYVAI